MGEASMLQRVDIEGSVGGSRRVPDMWTRLHPLSFRVALLLLGDERSATRVARRTYVRTIAQFRHLRRADDLEVWCIRSTIRSSRRRAILRALRRSPSEGIGRLSFRRRAAYVVATYLEMDPATSATVLDCSQAGSEAWLGRARASLDDPPTREDMAHTVASAHEPPFDVSISRRVWATRFAAVATVVAVVSAGVWGGIRLADRDDAVDDAVTIQVPENTGPSDARADLARLGAPGWCPFLRDLDVLGSEGYGGASDAAMRFDIALAKTGYDRTIRALQLSSETVRKPERWPHHQTATGLGVIQLSSGASDPDLVRSCGREVADRSVKVGIMQRGYDGAIGKIVAFYAGRSAGAWGIWGSVSN